MSVLLAGIGNVFAGDDGFGVSVAAALARRTLPPGVRAGDYGIRGVHLAYELLDGCDGLVLVDAVPMGEPAGTVCVIEPEPPGADAPPVDAHRMTPDLVLTTLARLGGSLERVLVVGCQPASLGPGLGLSPVVAAAVEPAAALAVELAAEILRAHEEALP
ncbi:MAG: hydrogenase maturation protease [Actinomycetota bacterium]|nr:hydrogenase maturation protease [Actinomycetota bacterium]